MEYAVAAGGLNLTDIMQKMTANPWTLVAIAAVIALIYFITTRA